MLNIIQEYKQGVEAPKLINIEGNEKLTLPESLSFGFKRVYHNIQKFYSKFNFNIHTADSRAEISRLIKSPELYIKHSTKEIITPDYFNPNMPGWMTIYVDGITKGIVLSNILKTETDVMYTRIKNVINTGELKSRFSWTITSTDQLIEESKRFLEEQETAQNPRFQLNQVYQNFKEISYVYDKFNSSVKEIKSRDTEMLSKSLDQVYDLTSLLVEKIESNEIVVNKETIEQLESMFKEFQELVSLVGAYYLLLNEFSGTLTQQIKELKTIK